MNLCFKVLFIYINDLINKYRELKSMISSNCRVSDHSIVLAEFKNPALKFENIESLITVSKHA